MLVPADAQLPMADNASGANNDPSAMSPGTLTLGFLNSATWQAYGFAYVNSYEDHRYCYRCSDPTISTH